MTFLVLTDGDLAAGAALTEEKVRAGMRDNLAGTMNGDANAPRLQADAIAAESDFLINVNASDDHEITHGLDIVEGAVTNSTGNYVVGYTITVLSFTGSIRFTLTIGTDSADHDLRIKKTSGGSTTVLQTWSGSDEDTRTIDVPIAVGDVIEWEHRVDSGLIPSSVRNPLQSGDVFLEDREVYREAT